MAPSQTDDFLAGRVALFITEGLVADEQGIVLATLSRRAAVISARVVDTGFAFRQAVTDGH